MSPGWCVPQFDEHAVSELVDSLHISPVLARLLLHRGLHTPLEAAHFLNPDLSMMHDPFSFHQMKMAVTRVQKTIDSNQKIMIHGDYDADGITGSAILMHVLSKYTKNLMFYIPHRINQGYGLKTEAVDIAKKEKIDLIITVDCGITAVDEVKLANEYGIDVIITDHHLFHDTLPSAFAIIHPGQPNETYPYHFLSGAGVAYKFAQALELTMESTFNLPKCDTENLLDLAAIGTVSDIVTLNGENRVIAKHGLAQLAKTKRPGLKALLNKTKLTNKPLESWHIGYIIGPRINAAGRLGDADRALELLLTDSDIEAMKITDVLDQYNKDRQKVEADVFEQAEELVNSQINLNTESVIVLSNPNWHIGVLGIVCSKLVDEFERPTILIGLNGEQGKGSGRSVDGFHIVEALNDCSDTLLAFGGHEMACGLTIEPSKVIEFRNKINAFAKKSGYLPSASETQLDFDTEVTIADLTEKLLESLSLLEPHGPGNPQPLFLVRNVKIEGNPRVIKDKHLKLYVKDNGYRAEAMWWNNAEKASLFYRSQKSYDIACYARINEYNGIRNVELKVKDIRESD